MFKMIRYKTDILKELKNKGYNTTIIRKNNLISQGCLTNIRNGKPIDWTNLNKLCLLLQCDISDILEYVPDDTLN